MLSDNDDRRLDRRRVLTAIGASGAFVAGRAGADPGGGNGNGGHGTGGTGGNGARGVGPCVCDSCPAGTFCGKIDGAPVTDETYTFTDDGDEYSVTIETTETTENGETTGFTFSTTDDIEKVCVKGGPDTETYTEPDEGDLLRPPLNPGANRPEISTVSFCGTAGRYLQVDLFAGDLIEDLTETDRYGPNRLLATFSINAAGGSPTMSFPSPYDSGSTTVRTDDDTSCTVSWSNFGYDGSTRTATASVRLDSDEDCEVGLAIYELPAGTTMFDEDRIDEQTYVDGETTTLSKGDSTDLEADAN